ncbi:MAG TPA: YoaK family protein, partial [Bacillota bacterium]|nr:YoaK family protein [Bacillota bacterium]
SISNKTGSLVDRKPGEASKTAKHAATILVSAGFGTFVLSMVGGYVDTAGFILLYGLFTAHVTGDLITAAAVMINGLDFTAIARLSMIPIFMITVGLITLFTRAINRRGAATLPPLLFLMTILLFLFGYVGDLLNHNIKSANSWLIIVVGGLGVAAMGVQNSLMKGALKSFAQTTLMTGNLTQFTIDLTDYLFPGIPKKNQKARIRAKQEAAGQLKKSGRPLLGFMFGAGIGAWMTKLYAFRCILGPLTVVFLLWVIAAWRSRKFKGQ